PVEHVVAVGADLFVGGGLEVIARSREARSLRAVRTAFLLPFDAAAIDQLDLVVAVVLQGPVRVGGKPVVVVAVEDDCRLGGDSAAPEELGKRVLRRDVASNL